MRADAARRGVTFVALDLPVRRHVYQFRSIEPPYTAGVKLGSCFRPQLVAIIAWRIHINSAQVIGQKRCAPVSSRRQV
jgi:hypothetical protein